MVDWIDWGGHWQVIIGLDTIGTDDTEDDVLVMADPYDTTDHYQDGYYTVPLVACGGKDPAEKHVTPMCSLLSLLCLKEDRYEKTILSHRKARQPALSLF